MNHQGKKIAIVLLLIVILPALFYSVYEISKLDETEEIAAKIYEKQLDAVLFSVNMYITDVASNWATQIETYRQPKRVADFLSSNRSLHSIIISDSTTKEVRILSLHSGLTEEEGKQFIISQKEKIDRLFRYKQVEYRKLEPVVVSSSKDSLRIALLFVTAQHTIVVMNLNSRRFIDEVVARQLSRSAGNEFIFAVEDSFQHSILYSTQAVKSEEITVRRPLWIFPNYRLGIRLLGTTIEEYTTKRFYQNLALIALLDIVLIIGAWIVFRTVNREMQLIALKSDFVSNVSHELRTPLALIRMFAETLEMKRVKTEKKKHEYYHIILQETERLTRLVNNILNFSRIERGVREYRFQRINVNEIIRSVMNMYSYQLREKHFTTKIVLDETLPDTMADEEAIAEALHNLIDNSIKYSADKKYLRIETKQEKNLIVIEVEDKGIGIAPEHHSKIFEKFFRVSQGLVHTAKGSGLGLSLVHHIIHAHCGTINVKSTVGEGSTFIITLPINTTE